MPGIKDRSLQEISALMDGSRRHVIDHAPWPDFNYKPQVNFAIGHSDDGIFLKFYVTEKFIRVLHHQDNDPVYEDSCVEFFVSFDDDTAYYNLEFNCIGACLAGYGKGRNDRQLIPSEILKKIRRLSTIESLQVLEGADISWELCLAIPLEVFIHHRLSSLKHRNCRVNFYKCGDQLPSRHFLAWKEIFAAEPDFHLPEYFGAMQFAPPE
jgi:hypothetical protein